MPRFLIGAFFCALAGLPLGVNLVIRMNIFASIKYIFYFQPIKTNEQTLPYSSIVTCQMALFACRAPVYSPPRSLYHFAAEPH